MKRFILMLAVTTLILMFSTRREIPLSAINLLIDCKKINSIQQFNGGVFNTTQFLILNGSFDIPPANVSDTKHPVSWNASSKAQLMNVFWNLEPFVEKAPLNSFLTAEMYFISIDPGRPRMAMTFSGDMVFIEIDDRH